MQQVISWFGNINDKDRHSFILFDIVDFYPSISEKLLNEALAWASNLATISKNNISIVKHARNLYFSATANYGQKKTEATVYLTSLCVVSTSLKFVSWWAFSF
jgi:hypothetical protein